MRAGRTAPDGLDEQVDEALARARGARRQAARRPRGSAAGVGALRRARVDAGDDGHGPEPRPERRVGRRAGGAHRQRALRLGLATGASCRCSATSCAASRASASRRRSRAIKRERGVTLDTELDADALRELTDALPGALRLPHRPARAARPGDPRRVRLLDGRARGALPAHQPDPRRLGHGRQRAADGVRQQGRDVRLRRRVQPRRGDRRARAVAATSCSNAQGEDVVSGRAHPARPLRAARLDARGRTTQLREILRELERHYNDMQDTEFTVEEGRLYMLQTRNAKRPAQAAVRFAVDAVAGGPADQGGGDRDDRRRLARRAAAPDVRPRPPTTTVLARGVAASPGAAKGAIVFTAAGGGRRAAADGRDVILVRPFTEADDVAGLSRRRRASSPPRAARPRTRRSSRAAWAALRSPAPPSSTSTSTPARCASAAASCARAT